MEKGGGGASSQGKGRNDRSDFHPIPLLLVVLEGSKGHIRDVVSLQLIANELLGHSQHGGKTRPINLLSFLGDVIARIEGDPVKLFWLHFQIFI